MSKAHEKMATSAISMTKGELTKIQQAYFCVGQLHVIRWNCGKLNDEIRELIDKLISKPAEITAEDEKQVRELVHKVLNDE